MTAEIFNFKSSKDTNISEALYGHTKPCSKLNTKTLYKIGGRGTKSCPLCLTEKLPNGNYVNHIE